MTLADLSPGESVFLDANVFVYHFEPHALFGPPCTNLLKRIELLELAGFTSTHVLGEVAHRLMTLEASVLYGWPSHIVQRLKQSPACVQQLTRFRSALQNFSDAGIHILTIEPPLLDAAAAISQATGILSNDAMIVAIMKANNLTNIASHDADFDRVPGITRYAPA
jgi:predicted nucleic acid-binding protein